MSWRLVCVPIMDVRVNLISSCPKRSLEHALGHDGEGGSDHRSTLLTHEDQRVLTADLHYLPGGRHHEPTVRISLHAYHRLPCSPIEVDQHFFVITMDLVSSLK